MSEAATPEKTIKKKGSPRKAKTPNKKKLTKKDLKDKDAPQRAKTSFMYFGDTVRADIIAELKKEAETNGTKFAITKVGAQIAAKWKSCAPEVKAECERKAREDKERKDREQKVYEDSGKAKEWKEKVKAMKASGDFAKVRKKRKVPPKVMKELAK